MRLAHWDLTQVVGEHWVPDGEFLSDEFEKICRVFLNSYCLLACIIDRFCNSPLSLLSDVELVSMEMILLDPMALVVKP